ADESLVDLLREASVGDYFAIMAYLPASSQTDDLLRALRVFARDWRHVATIVGYGPRFLHSTGQLHKGGPNSGLFAQIVASPHEEVEIPGEPYSFGTLLRAQALGDFRSLTAHGRRAIRLDIGQDASTGLARLSDLVTRAA